MKTIEVPVRDCVYNEKFGWFVWSGCIYITKRWGDKCDDYWGYLANDGNDIKVKFIEV